MSDTLENANTELNVILISDKGEVSEVPMQNTLDAHKKLVGGFIEMIRTPDFFPQNAVAVINEEGKFHADCKPNVLATKLFGSVLLPGDFISGNLFIVGIDDEGESISSPVSLAQIQEFLA